MSNCHFVYWFSYFFFMSSTTTNLDAACKYRLAWWCRYTVGLRMHYVRERDTWRRIVNLFETSSHSRHPSSPIGAIVLLRTISSRKITNSLFQDYTNSSFQNYTPSRKIIESPFQDSSFLPLSLTWCICKPPVPCESKKSLHLENC